MIICSGVLDQLISTKWSWPRTSNSSWLAPCGDLLLDLILVWNFLKHYSKITCFEIFWKFQNIISWKIRKSNGNSWLHTIENFLKWNFLTLGWRSNFARKFLRNLNLSLLEFWLLYDKLILDLKQEIRPKRPNRDKKNNSKTTVTKIVSRNY